MVAIFTTRPLWAALEEIDNRAGAIGDELPLLSVSKTRGIVRYSDLFPDRAVRATDLKKYKLVKSGEIVLNKMSAATGAIGLVSEPGVVSPDYSTFRVNSGVESRYVMYVTKNKRFLDEVEIRLRGIGVGEATNVRTPRVNISSYLSIPCYLPGLDVQRRIADYLDAETTQIDAMMAKLDEQVELLRERQSALIENKLHEIDSPCKPLWVAAEVNAPVPEMKSVPFGTELTFIPLENVWPLGSADYSERKAWSKDIGSYTNFRNGDILVPKVTPTVSHGRSFVTKAPTAVGLASTEVHTARARTGVLAEFVTYNLLTKSFLELAGKSAVGVGGLKRISPQFLNSYQIPLPPLDEQRRIVAELDENTARIDRMIDKCTELRELLKERRAALITAVVTGQKEV